MFAVSETKNEDTKYYQSIEQPCGEAKSVDQGIEIVRNQKCQSQDCSKHDGRTGCVVINCCHGKYLNNKQLFLTFTVYACCT